MLNLRRFLEERNQNIARFQRFESHNPYEILEKLDREALPSLRRVFADGAGPAIEKLRRRLSTIGLFCGSKDSLMAVLFDRLDKAFCRNDFHSFRLTINPKCAYLDLEILHRSSVAAIRIWRGRRTFFAVGDPDFEPSDARSLQEVLAEKLNYSAE